MGPSESVIGESRWPPAGAVLVLIALTVALRLMVSGKQSLGPPWLSPVIELLLLLVLLVRDPGRGDIRHVRLRRVGIVLVGLLVAVALWATVALIVELIRGSGVTNSADLLLASGAVVWIGNNIAFALLYWEFDGGGPVTRAQGRAPYPDLAFPQQLNPELAPPGWRPLFWDYLYLGFTNGIAFSPTDVMPLARWAKLAMAVQATVALSLIGLVVARAVNAFT